MKFQRGFKAQANHIALSARRELDLEPYAPLCPWEYAAFLGIPVVTLQSLVDSNPKLKDYADHLARPGSKAFSAITIFDGHRRLIVHNHGHAATRQRSDLAHELAHALLMHPPHPPFCGSGKRVYDSTLENEAAWLGPVLLVPNEAAHWAIANDLADEEAAARHFGVSRDLIRFRFQMSGARKKEAYMKQKV